MTGDHDRLVQVVTNVLGNALAYTPAGGQVHVTTHRDRDTALVEVTDTGPGPTPDQVTAVFERFYRADRSRLGGTGIGLTIARRHGDDIVATSPGLGHGAPSPSGSRSTPLNNEPPG